MTSWHYHLDGRDKIMQRHTKGYHINFTFEGYSGADVVITPLKLKISQDTLQEHLDCGAVMIQVKNSRDFDASVVDQRLFDSLLRMNTWKTQAYQCGLLITGRFENISGQLYIDGQRSMITWKGYQGALNAWNIRGGVVWPIIQREDVQDFIDGLGNKLFTGSDPFVQAGQPKARKKYRPQKIFSKGMTLRQKARLAASGPSETDLRHLLMNIDGLTNTTVSAIWELIKTENLPLNMNTFINLVIEGRLVEIKGIGPKTQEKVKAQLGYG